MRIKVALAIAVILAVFLGFVATRKGHFHYERSGVIAAPAERIFPYLSDFHRGQLWNPFAQKDPAMKITYSGPESGVGAMMEFDGNREAGTGKLEILSLVPNRSVDIRLTMIKPFAAVNQVHYELAPEGTGTRFTWSMEGDNGFMGKLVSVFVDCDKMIGGEFDKGIALLKAVAEKT